MQQKKPKQRKERNSIDLIAGRLMYEQVLIEPIVINESANGLYNPAQYEDKPEFGKVLLVGMGRLLDNGTIIKPTVKVGDTVLFQKYSAQKIRVNSLDYLLIREDDIYWIK